MNEKFKSIILSGVLFIGSCLIYSMIFLSAIYEIHRFFEQKPFWFLVNAVFVFAGILILRVMLGRSWITLLVSSVITLLWSIADHFTVLYHGNPLFPDEYANFRTAMEVADGYSFTIDAEIVIMTGFFAVLLVITAVVKKLEARFGAVAKEKRRLLRLADLGLGTLLILAVCYFVLGPHSIKPETTMGWSWKAGVSEYGFLVCSLEDLHNHISEPYRMPEGYSVEALSERYGDRSVDANDDSDKDSDGSAAGAGVATVYPDIIVILNETFYDLDAFFLIDPDVSPLEKYYSVENAVYGYAATGGDTNDSEYELLTSNSLFLLNYSSPFNFVDLKDRPGAAEYMKSLGYTTTGMHIGMIENYHRNIVYRDMGFDHIYLGEDDFKYVGYNYNRYCLDSDNYRDLLDHLDEEASKPQFMYLLTYQNHGGYEQNDDSVDTVHTGVDYGDKTDEVNEYLSSLKISAEAFYDLTEELKGRRPTVVVMVGDHSPNLGGVLTVRDSSGGYKEELANTLVPYVFWTNYKEVPAGYGGLSSMEDLIPMALEVAGLPLSPYYDTILRLHDAVPLRNKYGMYVDAEGDFGEYSADSGYYDLMNDYLYMEYNSLGDEAEIRRDLFLPND